MVSSPTATSAPGEFFLVHVADENSKISVWWCPKEQETLELCCHCKHIRCLSAMVHRLPENHRFHIYSALPKIAVPMGNLEYLQYALPMTEVEYRRNTFCFVLVFFSQNLTVCLNSSYQNRTARKQCGVHYSLV